MSAQYDSYSMQYTTLCRCLSIKHLVNVQIKVVPLSQKQRPIYSRDVLRLINLSTRLKCARHSISSIFFQVLYSRKWFVSCPQVVCSSSPFKPIVRLMSFFWELGRSLIIRAFSRRKVYVLRPFPAGVKNPNGITSVASISFETLVYSCVSTAYAKQKRFCWFNDPRIIFQRTLFLHTYYDRLL